MRYALQTDMEMAHFHDHSDSQTALYRELEPAKNPRASKSMFILDPAHVLVQAQPPTQKQIKYKMLDSGDYIASALESTKYFILKETEESKLREKFEASLRLWKRETQSSSSDSELFDSMHFRKIVALGQDAVPYILESLQDELSHIYVALGDITGKNPAKDVEPGDVRAEIGAWLDWGREQGLLGQDESVSD